jgi:LPS-assembly protein
LNAFELETHYDVGRFSGSLLYGRFAAQPDIGYFDTREGIVGTARVQLTDSLFVSGGARYDLDVGRFDALQAGFGFINCCMGVSFVYAADWSREGIPLNTPDQKFLFSISLRTLGGFGTPHDLLAGLDQSQSRALP